MSTAKSIDMSITNIKSNIIMGNKLSMAVGSTYITVSELDVIVQQAAKGKDIL